ncbi:MAG: hypothetical protein JSV29_02740 [Candidatus Bathyarchaeota archaeon]|nr:MAG: hypothetical protein JSV29_02740 [Candidatus Bathyarchaeota archaeon]
MAILGVGENTLTITGEVDGTPFEARASFSNLVTNLTVVLFVKVIGTLLPGRKNSS